MSKFSEWLGTSGQEVIEGYVKNQQTGLSPVCLKCGALVSYDFQEIHTAWHRANEQ